MDPKVIQTEQEAEGQQHLAWWQFDSAQRELAFSPNFGEVMGLSGNPPSSVSDLLTLFQSEDHKFILSLLGPPARVARTGVARLVSRGTSRAMRVVSLPLADGIFTSVTLLETIEQGIEEPVRVADDYSSRILESITDLVLVKGKRSNILWANRAFRDFYGMTNAQLQGIIDAPFNEPDYTEQYIRDDQRVFQTGEAVNIPVEPVTRHDGRVRFFHTVKSPIRDADGQASALVAVLRDMTERMDLVERLSEADEQFDAFMDHLPGVAFMKDEKGKLIYVNACFENMFRTTRREVLGRSDYDLFEPEVAAQNRRNDQIVIDEMRPLDVIEIVPTPEGSARHWRTLKFPIPGPGGATFIGGIALDLTEKKELRKEKAQAASAPGRLLSATNRLLALSYRRNLRQ